MKTIFSIYLGGLIGTFIGGYFWPNDAVAYGMASSLSLMLGSIYLFKGKVFGND